MCKVLEKVLWGEQGRLESPGIVFDNLNKTSTKTKHSDIITVVQCCGRNKMKLSVDRETGPRKRQRRTSQERHEGVIEKDVS